MEFDAHGETRPNPDPTAATLAHAQNAINCLREVIEARLNGMDAAIALFHKESDLRPAAVKVQLEQLEQLLTAKIDGMNTALSARLVGMDEATRLRYEKVEQLAPAIKEQVARLQSLHEEKFASVATQFKERDTRSERESRDNKVAVDAAFAAQKEAAAKQDEANQKAIDKSEKATTDTIKTNAELVRTTTDGLSGKIDDLKVRFSALEGQMAQNAGRSKGMGDGWGIMVAAVGVVALIAGVVIGVISLVHHP